MKNQKNHQNKLLSNNQKIWVEGFIDGYRNATEMKNSNDEKQITTNVADNTKNKKINILFASQTGNAESLAADLGDALGVTPSDMAEVETEQLEKMKTVIIITSTYGDGEHPDSGQVLWNEVSKIKDLSKINFCILGLGDMAYDMFCNAADEWEKVLLEKNATKFLKTLKLDVDYEKQAEQWIEKLKTKLVAKNKTVKENNENSNLNNRNDKNSNDEMCKNETLLKSKFTKKNPYNSKLLAKKTLSKNGSTKQIIHFEFEINNEDVKYEVGDALGIIPTNQQDTVDALLRAGNWAGNQKIAGKSLNDILKYDLEIRLPTKNLISAIAEKANNKQLESIISNKIKLEKFIIGKEIIDLVQDYDTNFSAEEFINLLPKIKHRLYSIASSPNMHKGQVHLTVSKVEYENDKRKCLGVASGYLANLEVGKCAKMFIQPNKNFSLPEDDNAKIIMVGPGTGIAPFVGFIQERHFKKASGSNWLFFGDREKEFDFLYEKQLKEFEKNQTLKLNCAWSRDENIKKTYVQDEMLKCGKKIYNQLNNGAYFYLCGDANKMAKDVEAKLIEIISTFGAMPADKAVKFLNKLKKQNRYTRDIY